MTFSIPTKLHLWFLPYASLCAAATCQMRMPEYFISFLVFVEFLGEGTLKGFLHGQLEGWRLVGIRGIGSAPAKWQWYLGSAKFSKAGVHVRDGKTLNMNFNEWLECIKENHLNHSHLHNLWVPAIHCSRVMVWNKYGIFLLAKFQHRWSSRIEYHWFAVAVFSFGKGNQPSETRLQRQHECGRWIADLVQVIHVLQTLPIGIGSDVFGSLSSVIHKASQTIWCLTHTSVDLWFFVGPQFWGRGPVSFMMLYQPGVFKPSLSIEIYTRASSKWPFDHPIWRSLWYIRLLQKSINNPQKAFGRTWHTHHDLPTMQVWCIIFWWRRVAFSSICRLVTFEILR